MRAVLAVVILSALACRTTAPSPLPAPVAAESPCNPGHSILSATLWLQQSAEYRAVALGTYAAARRALDAALADPSWSGALEENPNDPPQPPAVILDLDETAVDNSGFEARVIRAGQIYDSAKWKSWVAEGIAAPVPGASEFLAYAQSRGVTPFYVTNRDMDEMPGTRANLERLGYPLLADADNLLLRGKQPEWKSDKSTRRAWVASRFRVLLLIGDDLNDFAPAREKSAAERLEIVANGSHWWGTRWFMLPNPMYGSWERAAVGSGGSPCEEIQRKVDVLRER